MMRDERDEAKFMRGDKLLKDEYEKLFEPGGHHRPYRNDQEKDYRSWGAGAYKAHEDDPNQNKMATFGHARGAWKGLSGTVEKEISTKEKPKPYKSRDDIPEDEISQYEERITQYKQYKSDLEQDHEKQEW